MSSFVRRLEIRLMKRAGYTRNKWVVAKDERGNNYPKPVSRDGEITDRDDNPPVAGLEPHPGRGADRDEATASCGWEY